MRSVMLVLNPVGRALWVEIGRAGVGRQRVSSSSDALVALTRNTAHHRNLL